MNGHTARLLRRFADHFSYDLSKVKRKWKETPWTERAGVAAIIRRRLETEPRAERVERQSRVQAKPLTEGWSPIRRARRLLGIR